MPRQFDHDRASKLLRKVKKNDYKILTDSGLRGENQPSLELKSLVKLLGKKDYAWFNGPLRTMRFKNIF